MPEAIDVQVPEVAFLALEDLLTLARKFLNLAFTRADLARCLRRHGVGTLRSLRRERDA